MQSHPPENSANDETIRITKTPDGGINIELRAVRQDKNDVLEALKKMTQDCADNTYGMFDRIRDSESRSKKVRGVKRGVVEETEIRTIRKVVRRKRRRFFGEDVSD